MAIHSKLKQVFDVTHYTYRNAKIHSGLNGYRMVQVSDFHNAAYGSEIIAAIRTLNPQLIAITGDLFDRHRPDVIAPAFSLLHQAVTLAPVYFVQGNHETTLADYPRLIRQMREIGVHVLEDEAVSLQGFRLIGLKERADLQTLNDLIRPDRLNVVLSHRVEAFKMYAAAGADLVLSGHAHGGQARPFGLALYAPQQGPFPRYTKGVYTRGQTTMIASAGLGDGKLPRVCNRPELVCVTLAGTS
ncbi:MAG: metallophosphoesterase family protein [Clostridiales bacterium]|nr:metallophosphoesterase family protein [Clostridiales bacterium]